MVDYFGILRAELDYPVSCKVRFDKDSGVRVSYSTNFEVIPESATSTPGGSRFKI